MYFFATKLFKASYAKSYLENWMDLTKKLSKNGKCIISDFEQVPKDFRNIYKNTVLYTSLELQGHTKKGKLAYRKIVQEQNPKLLVSFDTQFPVVKK